MDLKRLIPAMAAVALTLAASPARAAGEDDELGVWASVNAEKKLTKKWNLFAEGEFRTQDGVSAVERWSLAVGTDYRLLKWLKADASYTFIHSYREEEITGKGNIIPSYWLPRHRVNVSLSGSVKWNRFKFALRERWQYTYRPQQFVEKYDPNGNRKDDEKVKGKGEHMMRTRLQVEYDIAKCDFTPYASCELYYNTYGTEKTRWTVGTEYKINKKNSVEAYYRYQNHSDEDEANGHVIGIGYSVKF